MNNPAIQHLLDIDSLSFAQLNALLDLATNVKVTTPMSTSARTTAITMAAVLADLESLPGAELVEYRELL